MGIRVDLTEFPLRVIKSVLGIAIALVKDAGRELLRTSYLATHTEEQLGKVLIG
jgi:hypothetical protein